MTKVIRFVVIALIATTAVGVGAQDKPAPAAQDKPAASPPQRAPVVPLKIQLVLSRFQGDKKVSSVPYVMWVTTNEGTTQLRMGVNMPVSQGMGGVSYKDVGTSIDCSAVAQPDGFFKISLTVSDSSVYFGDKGQKEASATQSAAAGMPSFRSFTSRFFILLRDGQTGQYTSATDQVSGEVMKIDATLNVLK